MSLIIKCLSFNKLSFDISEQTRNLVNAIVMEAVSQPGGIALDIFCHLMETLKHGDEDI